MSEAVVSLRGVRVLFGTHVALDEVDLEIRAGEHVALVGPSGAGKTTVLRLCTASLVPTSGSVRVLNTDLATATPPELRAVRRKIGAIYQHLHLVGPLRVVHNVNAGRLGSWTVRRALRSLIRPIDLPATRAALARVGIEDKIFERTDRLSGGEQQRVALARVLVQEPQLVLADEPVSSLDPVRTEEVMDLLTGVVAGRDRTLLVSLHDFELARRRCHRVIGLRQGKVLFDLPAAEVTNDHRDALYLIPG